LAELQEVRVAKPDLDALKREIMSLSEARTASRLAVVAESGTRSKEQKLLVRERREALRQIALKTLMEMGVDSATLERKLSEERRSFRDAAKPPEIPRTSETLTTRKNTFENDIAKRRATFGSVGSIPTTPWSSTVYLPEPFFIWVSPAKSSSFVTNTMTAPFDSRVKFLVPSTEYDGSIFISFYFTWFNDSIFQATITNLSSQLVLNGNAYGYVSAPPFFFGLFEGERDLSFGTFADWTISQGSKLEGRRILEWERFRNLCTLLRRPGAAFL
jgi:hypothetical protein